MVNQDQFCVVLEVLANEWDDRYRPEDIRLDTSKIKVLLIAADKDVANEVASKCPVFTRLFRSVLLRDIEEFATDGAVKS